MTTEQKAKRYDEAIERVVNIRTGKCETTFIFTEGLFNYLFPELEECNGEEVRKAMIDFFKHEREEGVTVLHYGVNIERMIAWLEKQGKKEQDARYKDLEELLDADDIYQMAMNDEMVEEAKSKAINALSELQISKLLGLEKQGEQNLIMAKSPQLGEQKPTISDDALREGIARFGISQYQIDNWLKKYVDVEKQSEQKAIMNVPPREVILSIWDLGNEWKELTNGCISTEYGTQLDYIQKYWKESEYYLRAKQGERKPQRMISAEAKEAMYGKPAWSEEDNKNLEKTIWYVEKGGKLIFAKTDELVSWLNSLKGRVGCEANCTTIKEWSEEDEAVVKDICDKLNRLSMVYFGNDKACQKDIDWLKSLEDRYTWKPSERQIMCLQDALSDYHRRGYKAETLETLLKQLKQL